ncbi:MAG: hypothetical protein HOP09_12575 [Hyphomicrobium sp.]|nr:hypothetical protein [Hyphomicrobium sp.]
MRVTIPHAGRGRRLRLISLHVRHVQVLIHDERFARLFDFDQWGEHHSGMTKDRAHNDNITKLQARMRETVSLAKIDLNSWIQTDPHRAAEIRIACLELAAEGLVADHGRDGAAEIMMLALERAAPHS